MSSAKMADRKRAGSAAACYLAFPGLLTLCGVALAQTWTFTTCDTRGPLGPNQTACDAAYLGSELESRVTVEDGIQRWAVPVTGLYRLSAVGASGDARDFGSFGGRGAALGAELVLEAGENLKILVGQRGDVTPDSRCNAAGGGGSFIVSSTDVPLLIAGGGGGLRAGSQPLGCDASLTTFAVQGETIPVSQCDLKSVDEGLGGVVSADTWGSGGAGFFGDGAVDPDGFAPRDTLEYGSAPARAWAGGMTGGLGTTPGGFGGGGQGDGSCGGGGGGGYSGGDSGHVAGGGASFFSAAASNPVAGYSLGFFEADEGRVNIELLDIITPPDPAQSRVAVRGPARVSVGSAVEIEVEVIDEEGDPVPDLEVTLTPSPSAAITLMPGAMVTTDAGGRAVFRVSSSVAQSVRFTASYNPDLGSVGVTWGDSAADAEAIPTLDAAQLLLLSAVLGLLGARRRRARRSN